MTNYLFHDFWAPFWQLLGTILLHFGRLGWGGNLESIFRRTFGVGLGTQGIPLTCPAEGKKRVPGPHTYSQMATGCWLQATKCSIQACRIQGCIGCRIRGCIGCIGCRMQDTKTTDAGYRILDTRCGIEATPNASQPSGPSKEGPGDSIMFYIDYYIVLYYIVLYYILPSIFYIISYYVILYHI